MPYVCSNHLLLNALMNELLIVTIIPFRLHDVCRSTNSDCDNNEHNVTVGRIDEHHVTCHALQPVTCSITLCCFDLHALHRYVEYVPSLHSLIYYTTNLLHFTQRQLHSLATAVHPIACLDEEAVTSIEYYLVVALTHLAVRHTHDDAALILFTSHHTILFIPTHLRACSTIHSIIRRPIMSVTHNNHLSTSDPLQYPCLDTHSYGTMHLLCPLLVLLAM